MIQAFPGFKVILPSMLRARGDTIFHFSPGDIRMIFCTGLSKVE
ncbi:MAG: hypothetical protein U9Q05_13685 [Thermodesulfobacteriota bacterium]|nr:hypothetical protein [Thermodesulfobacteriota bacterium]